jgi:NTP pyrophosphatase (non-canonical NTP hydrolase)
MNRKGLELNVIEWAEEKNLTDPVKQTLKTLSEAGELADAVCKDVSSHSFVPFENKEKYKDVIDAIGDIEVCLTILKRQLGLEQDEPLEVAWNVIKDRKGKTVNGTFVKEK